MIAGVKTLDDLDVRDKRVLVRLDLNSDVRNGTIIPSERLRAPLVTLKELQKKGASVVILAHQGRPGEKDCISLKQHAAYLNRFMSVRFVPDVCGEKALKAISTLGSGEVLLLDNVRTIPDEMKYTQKSKLVTKLAPFFDYYVNDAFSASHREHASIVGFPRVLESALGRTFENELEAVHALNITNATLVLGGVKIDDYSDLINHTRGLIIPTGYLGILAGYLHGVRYGAQDAVMKQYKPLLKVLEKHSKRIVMPVDFAVEDTKGRRSDVPLYAFPSKHRIYDVGVQTIETYKRVMHVTSLFFKGLPGLCHTKPFMLGTSQLLRAASKAKFSLIAGGHTSTFMEQHHISKKAFDYVSMSGGALMHYLVHHTLPGLEAMKR